MDNAWFARLDAAETSDEIIRIIKDYLASWSPLDIARVAYDCRPPRRMVDADDVSLYALRLKQQCVKEDGGMVERMSNFFQHAVARISQHLARPPNDEHGDTTGQQ